MPAAVRRPVLTQSYPNYMPPMPPDGYQPITYYNDTIKQDVGVLYNPITGDVKSDGSYVSDMLASPDMAKHFGDDAQKSVEQKYVADMTPALQRPDALDMAQTSKPAPNMRADALDLPQTTNPDMGVDNYSKSGDERDFTRMNATNAYDVANMYNKPALEAVDLNDDRYDFVNRNQAEEPVLNYNPNEENDFINPNGTNAYDVASMYGGNSNEFPKDQAVFTGQEMPTGARLDPYMEIPQTDVPEGVLNAKGEPEPKGNGILNTDTTSSSDRKGSAVSSNARGSMMPYAKINRNEALMRIGGAIIGGSDQGFAGSARAATQEFGNIQDANRQAETAAYNKAEATRLAEERIAALKAKGSSKDKDKTSQTLNDVSTQLNSFQSGLDAIAQSKAEGGNLTGVGGIFKSFIDNYTGSPDAARRLLLSRLKVDDALLRVAETKGAISNKEMDLFLQPAPKNFQDEQIWVDWINERMVALRNVQNRLNGNVVINESEQSYRYRAPTSRNTTISKESQSWLDS